MILKMIPLFWLKFYYACFNEAGERMMGISFYLLMTCRKIFPLLVSTCWRWWYWSLFFSEMCRRRYFTIGEAASELTQDIHTHDYDAEIMYLTEEYVWCRSGCENSAWNIITFNESTLVVEGMFRELAKACVWWEILLCKSTDSKLFCEVK